MYTAAEWWPLAEDGGGNHLMVDTAPPPGGTPGQIIASGPDEDQRRVRHRARIAVLGSFTVNVIVDVLAFKPDRCASLVLVF